MEENRFEMVAKTFQGLEDVLRDELISIGASNVEIGNRMVTFEGDLEILYKANLCCRTALRILKPIVKFTAETPDELYDKVRDLEWSQFMDPDTTFSIDSTVYGDDFNHSKYVTYRVKDGIVDHFRDTQGRRPSIRLSGADLQLNVHISGSRVTISLDSSGEPLYKRGYREEQTEAPINEVLAAGIILKSGWRGDSDFLDPMCGSGTFLIEAALIAQNINPGIYRAGFAFEKWKDFNSDLFDEIYNDDSEERDFNYKIFGGDIDPEAISIAKKNVKSAHLEDVIELSCRPFSEWQADTAEGIIVTNPPYGERLRPDNLNQLYKELGSTLKNNFQGWHAWVIGYQEEQMKEIGLKPSVKIPLHNGNLECTLREFVMFDGSYSEFRADGGSVESRASLKKNSEKPRKVRRISDDEWEKESRDFNRGKSFENSHKKNKNFRGKDSRKEKPQRKMKEFSNSFDEERDFFEPSEDRKPFRNDRDDRKPFRNDRDDRKPFRNDRDDRKPFRNDRNDRKPYRNDRDDRKPFRNDRDDRKPFRNDRDDRKPFRNDRDDRKPFRNDRRDNGRRPGGPSSTYSPGNSRGPRLPESSQVILNEVHLRKRKKKDFPEDMDD